MVANSFRRELSWMNGETRAGEVPSPEMLSRVPLEVLGDLYLGLRPGYAEICGSLPPMPPAQVQRDWTGSDGLPLMNQSCAFVSSVATAFQEYVGTPLTAATVLDYGCGWGRLLRLMLRYVPGSQIWGLDPWDRSIDLCRKYNVPVNLGVCDYVPKTLPVGETHFDLIFAFSVFTHLSPKCALQVMTTLRDYLKKDGLLAITVRPPEYWRAHSPLPAGIGADAIVARHLDEGFAFIPHNREPIEGDVTYGDASYSLEYISKSWSGWSLRDKTFNPVDPLQTVLFFRRD